MSKAILGQLLPKIAQNVWLEDNWRANSLIGGLEGQIVWLEGALLVGGHLSAINMNLPWDGNKRHQHFVTANPTQYFDLYKGEYYGEY